MKQKIQRGFTLIELMVTVVIIGILASIALPNYTEFMRKSRRSDGKAALLSISQALERYYTENSTYSAPALSSTSSIGNTVSSEEFYTLAFDADPTSATVCGSTANTNPSSSSYRICATPTGVQSSDSCGKLSLSSTGVKTGTGTDCW
ncbi:type IV pilin protein [Propionivibrio limicola]|uniref:type IV pilin protein n=1 Tax=Propionivibrio limicola TaxID=167645 RepID=UPI0012910417|nr:type IV pilin protein [Propionivibrio limicola]